MPPDLVGVNPVLVHAGWGQGLSRIETACHTLPGDRHSRRNIPYHTVCQTRARW